MGWIPDHSRDPEVLRAFTLSKAEIAWMGTFHNSSKTLTKLNVEAVLDGEVVVLDEEGRSISSSCATGSDEKKITSFTTSSTLT